MTVFSKSTDTRNLFLLKQIEVFIQFVLQGINSFAEIEPILILRHLTFFAGAISETFIFLDTTANCNLEIRTHPFEDGNPRQCYEQETALLR